MKPDVDLIEAGNEIFSRQVAGYFVSAADARTQIASAMHELYLYSEPELEDEHFAKLKRFVLGQTPKQLTLFSPYSPHLFVVP